MTTVEVGPGTVRGPTPVDYELCAAAIESIDDTVMLVGDRPQAVRAVLTDLLLTAVGPGDDALTLVHPTWWSRRRVQTLLAAAEGQSRPVAAISRATALGADGGTTVVVEIAADHVAVTGAALRVFTRTADDTVCGAVLREVGCPERVFVDAPLGGEALSASIVAAVRRRGITATVTGAQPLRLAPPVAAPAPRRTGRRVIPALAGAVVATAGVGAVAVTHQRVPTPAEPTTLLVEGRAGVVVPALWTAERVTDGSGSARVQVTSPADPMVALHITQSALPNRQSLEQVADTLRTALEAEPDDVFTDFRAADERGGRGAVTYRERRDGHQTEWAVWADGTLRIGIGCQSPPGHTDLIRPACDAAVRSAHAVF